MVWENVEAPPAERQVEMQSEAGGVGSCRRLALARVQEIAPLQDINEGIALRVTTLFEIAAICHCHNTCTCMGRARPQALSWDGRLPRRYE